MEVTNKGSDAIRSVQPDEALWRVQEVAGFLHASASWVYHAAEAGRLPCVRLGGLLRFRPAEIRAWVDRQASRPASVIPLAR